MFGLPEADCCLSHVWHYSFDTWSENSSIRAITDFSEIYKENIKVWLSENSHWTDQQWDENQIEFLIALPGRNVWAVSERESPLAKIKTPNAEQWQMSFTHHKDEYVPLQCHSRARAGGVKGAFPVAALGVSSSH